MDVYAVPHTYFLTKPINLEHLKRALTISIKSAEKYSISINYNKSTYVVPIAKVSYIEGYGKSSVIHGCDGSINEVPVPLRFFWRPIKGIPIFYTYTSKLYHKFRIHDKIYPQERNIT